MKKLIPSLVLFSVTFAHAADVCMPSTLPETPEAGPVGEICETLVHRDNNKCPERTYQDQFPAVSNIEDLKTQANAKFGALGVRLLWTGTSNEFARWQNFSDTPADIQRAKRVMNIAYHALSLYPAGALRRAGMEKLQFTKQYEAKDVNNVYTIRSAGPFPQTKTMIYAENDDIPCAAGMEMRMHHELFHLIEGKVLGDMRPNLARWNALNPAGFRYGGGGNTAYGINGFQNLEHPSRGFASEYSTFGAEEDRCEIFGKLMTEGYSSRLNGWTSVDPVLRAKVDYIKNFMKNRISSQMDENFYRRVSPASE